MAVNQFSNSKLGDSNYDLIIVGGGMVGASLSLLLASRGIRKILIIESQSMDLSQSSHSSYGSSFDARSDTSCA